MKCKIIIGGLISIIMLTSCGDYLEKQAAKKELKKMLGSEIIFSENMTPKSLGHTIPDPGYIGSNKPFKVVSYTMPLFCSVCSLEVLEYWKTFMTSLNKEFGSDKIDFVFIFDYKNENELTEAIREFEFDYPVYYDRGYFVNSNLHMSKNPLCHTFLIQNNKIILVGHPAHNNDMEKLYIQTIKNILKNEQTD